MATNEAFQQAGWSAEDCDRLDEMVCAVVQSTAKLRKHLAVGPKPANPYQIPIPTISEPPARGRLVGLEADLRGKGSADPNKPPTSADVHFFAEVKSGSLSHQLTGAATLTTGAASPVRLSTRFRLSQEQIADQEVVAMLARRQASQLAGLEDLVLAAGTAGLGDGPRFDFGGSRVVFGKTDGFAPPTIVKCTDLRPAIKLARSALEKGGHPGPFALVLGADLYESLACDCHSTGKEYWLEIVRRWFAPDGFVVGLGADVRKGDQSFDNAGFVFSLEPGAFDVVSVAKPHIAFISRDEEGQVLAVEETLLLRRLDPSAVRYLGQTAP